MNKNILRAALGGLAILLSTCFCILTPRPALVFTPDQMPEARVGQPYHAEILISGNVTPVGNYSISAGALPPGLALVMDQQLRIGRISGTPTQPGTYSFTVNVWCYGTNISGQTGEKQYTLVVGK
ncbi:MAG: Ig domain-containing protein [Anaerolineales bacterium]